MVIRVATLADMAGLTDPETAMCVCLWIARAVRAVL